MSVSSSATTAGGFFVVFVVVAAAAADDADDDAIGFASGLLRGKTDPFAAGSDVSVFNDVGKFKRFVVVGSAAPLLIDLSASDGFVDALLTVDLATLAVTEEEFNLS